MIRYLPAFVAIACAAQVVLVPATVTDRHGKSITAISPGDFVLLDDGRPIKAQVDPAARPVSLVVLVQANNTSAAALHSIQNIGDMLGPLLTVGHAALLAFGAKIDLIQDFTSDPGRLADAFHNVNIQAGKTARLIDGVAEAIHLLGERPGNERRVLFVIGESRDRGSTTKLKDVVRMVQLEGVTVFPVVFSAYVTQFTTKPSEVPPPEDTDLLAAITEPARLWGKADVAHALARYSGGRKTSFATPQGLEKTLTNLREELQDQRVLSFTNDNCEPGLHRIEVRLKTYPDAVVRARYAYWIDQGSCGRDGPPKSR